MSKRQAEENSENLRKSTPKKGDSDTPASQMEDLSGEYGELEDLEGDDSDDDEIHEIDNENDENDDDSDLLEDGGKGKALKTIEEDELQNQQVRVQRVYVPQRSAPLGPNETMEPDMNAYHMLHSFNVDYPSLSFDIIEDNLGDVRTTYPQTTYLVSGTQAEKARDNSITVLKLDQMAKTYVADDDDENDDEEEGDDYEPRLDYLKLPTPHPTNRIRMNPHCKTTGEYFAASMSESGEAFIWDITQHFNWFDNPGKKVDKNKNRPAHTIRNHGNVEGFAIDWSPLMKTGGLLTGDMDGRIFFTKRTESGWKTDKNPFQADVNSQNRSVEDLQWSPREESIFASCGVDGYLRVWDIRSNNKKPLLSVKASDTDVNVISWNKKQPNLLASGDDAGRWAVWDMRNFKKQNPSKDAVVASFDFHKQPITAIEFSPLEESAVAVACEDNTVTLWDLSMEADDEEVRKQKESAGLGDIPPQMMFMHWQKDAKEVHFNKQFPGGLVATGSEGFSVFKTISF